MIDPIVKAILVLLLEDSILEIMQAKEQLLSAEKRVEYSKHIVDREKLLHDLQESE